MKVGITGGSGFLASHIIEELQSRDIDVLVFDTKSAGLVDAPMMLGDVRDPTAVQELAAHTDALIHLAAVLGTSETIDDPKPAIVTNVLGTAHVLDAARRYNIPVVYAGVGNFQMHNSYSTTKTAGERLVRQYRDYLGVNAAVVRPMNAYGPRQSVAAPFGANVVRKITPSFALRALSGIPLEVYGDGSQISDMVYVGDVARVFHATLLRTIDGHAPEHPVEVGPLHHDQVLETALTILDLCEARGYPSPGIEFVPMRPGELATGHIAPELVDEATAYLVGIGVDPRIARQVLRPLSNRVSADSDTLYQVGIDPASLTSVRDGMAITIDWYLANEGTAWRRPAIVG